MSVKAICPGTYDPPHRGHLETWATAAEIFGADNVTVLVAQNPSKQTYFQNIMRCRMVSAMLKSAGIPCHVIGLGSSVLTVDYAVADGVSFIVRGVRGPRDFEEEQALADINLRLRPDADIKTIFLPCGEGFHTLSSTLIRHVAAMRPAGWEKMVEEMAHESVVRQFKEVGS